MIARAPFTAFQKPPSAGGASPITITGLVGATNSSGTVTKTASETWGNAGYSSVETIVGDGYIEWIATETTTDRQVGLSTTDTDQHYNTIEYAWYMVSGGGVNALDIYAGGVSTGERRGPYVNGVTVLKIAREGTSIKFYKDGVMEWPISTGVPSGALVVDTAMFQNGCTIGPISMSQ